MPLLRVLHCITMSYFDNNSTKAVKLADPAVYVCSTAVEQWVRKLSEITFELLYNLQCHQTFSILKKKRKFKIIS